MTRVLLVTVGGSPEPILHAVRSHQPDEVVFVCSAPPCPSPSLEQVIGGGTPCRHLQPDGDVENRPNLVTQLELSGFRQDLQIVPLADPDNLTAIYQQLRQFCQQLRQRFTRLELIADYSGGTKTMSAALAMALVEEGAQLTVVQGERINLSRIDQSLGLADMRVSPLRASRSLRERLPLLLADHRYDRLGDVLAQYRSSCHSDLDQSLLNRLQRLDQVLQALSLWDHFRWQEALQLARQTALVDVFPELMAWWERVIRAHDWFVDQRPSDAITGYELVQDLLLNADRRGRRGWTDDAVARLYRALELLAQTYIQLELDGDGPQEDYPGAARLYRWLRERERGTGLGGCVDHQWGRLRDLLYLRNASLLGHGLNPVNQATWQSLQDRMTNLVIDTLAELGIQQGPEPCQLPGLNLQQLPDLRTLAALDP